MMNSEQLKRLDLIKSFVAEQGADGDKRWFIARLEAEAAENKRWQELHDAICDAWHIEQTRAKKAERRVEALEAENRRLRGLLLKHGWHTQECIESADPCTCGWNDIETALASQAGEEGEFIDDPIGEYVDVDARQGERAREVHAPDPALVIVDETKPEQE